MLTFPLTLVSRRGYAEKWSAEKWFPENGPGKIGDRKNLFQKMFSIKSARKFKRLFYFYQLIRLHTQKDVWRLRHDPTYAPNCRTLKESRKIYCRVLGFHRLITSEHSTHIPRCSTLTPWFFCFRVLGLFPSFVFVVEFWVFIDWSHPNIPHKHHDARRQPHDFSFLSFPGINFPGTNFPATIFPGDHFSGILTETCHKYFQYFISVEILSQHFLQILQISLRHYNSNSKIFLKTNKYLILSEILLKDSVEIRRFNKFQ